jgi:hypothetical protein
MKTNLLSAFIGGEQCFSKLVRTAGEPACRDDFSAIAFSVAWRQRTPQRSLPAPRSPILTLILFSQRLGVSAVNIPQVYIAA